MSIVVCRMLEDLKVKKGVFTFGQNSDNCKFDLSFPHIRSKEIGRDEHVRTQASDAQKH